MEKIIAPITSQEELRTAMEARRPVVAPPPASEALVRDYDPSQTYRPMNSTAAAATTLLGEKPKPLIGLYIVGGLILLSSLYTLTQSQGHTTQLIESIVTILLALGLLSKSNIARVIFVILGSLNVIFGFIGLESLVGSKVVGLRVSGLYVTIDIMTLAVEAIMVLYLTRPHVKAQFR